MIAFSVPDGTYPFAIQAPLFIHANVTGTVTVDGGNVLVDVMQAWVGSCNSIPVSSYSSNSTLSNGPTYQVTFREGGVCGPDYVYINVWRVSLTNTNATFVQTVYPPESPPPSLNASTTTSVTMTMTNTLANVIRNDSYGAGPKNVSAPTTIVFPAVPDGNYTYHVYPSIAFAGEKGDSRRQWI